MEEKSILILSFFHSLLILFRRCLSDSKRGCVPVSVRHAKILMTRNRLKNGFLTITAPALRQYIPRPLIYCPCPLALLPLPTSSDYRLAVYPALFQCFFESSVTRDVVFKNKNLFLFNHLALCPYARHFGSLASSRR